MGVDCKLKINNQYTSLDRWYVFSDEFQSGTLYVREEALKKLESLKDKIKKLNPAPIWGDGSDRTEYFLYWINLVYDKIKAVPAGTTSVIYNDNDVPEEYYMYRE